METISKLYKINLLKFGRIFLHSNSATSYIGNNQVWLSSSWIYCIHISYSFLTTPKLLKLIIRILMRRLEVIAVIASLLIIAQTQGVVILNRGCKSFDPNGNCISCSTRFYRDEEGICQPVNTNCNTYNSVNGACTSCYPGFLQI